jgi:hypothetical protein
MFTKAGAVLFVIGTLSSLYLGISQVVKWPTAIGGVFLSFFIFALLVFVGWQSSLDFILIRNAAAAVFGWIAP